MLFKREDDYEICSEAMASEILASASLDEDEFCNLMREVLERTEEGRRRTEDRKSDSNDKSRTSEEEGSAQMSVKL